MRAVVLFVVLALSVIFAVVLTTRVDPSANTIGDEAPVRTPADAPARPGDAASIPAAAQPTPGDSSVPRDCADLYESQMHALYDDVLTEERVDEILREARTTLGHSAQLELKLFAAQLADSAEASIEILRSAIDGGEVSPHFLWSAVNACLVARQSVACPAEDWLNQLLAVDSENSEAWIRAAAYHYEENDLERAKASLDRAAIAYESNSYWYEDIMAAKAGADAVGGFSERATYLMAVGFAAAFPSPQQVYAEMCNDMSGRDPEWARSCAAYGERAGEMGSTIMTQQLARAIQASALVALGEPADSDRIAALKAPPRLASDREMLRYPDSIIVYLSALERGSEASAVEALLEENARHHRSATPPVCGDFRLD